ncbi:MAG: hypothetical protein ACE5GE_15645, partial [Phycisphaerae bacterium]
YRKLFNYPAAYYWRHLCGGRYRYLSWCGTCRWSQERRQRREMLVAALRAGPVFVVANLVLEWSKHWVIGSVVVLVCLIGLRAIRNRVARRRSMRGEVMGPEPR